MNKFETEKSLKRFLKRNIGYSLATLICFMINGNISLGADINTELNIQKLLKDVREEKDILEEKILETEKGIALLNNTKDKSRQFFFSFLHEERKAHDYDDNGYTWNIDNGDKEEDINIPDLITPVKPDVPIIDNPLPNEDDIVNVPDFDFKGVGEIAIGNIPSDITIDITAPNIPIKEIGDGDFNIFDENSISKPDNIVGIDAPKDIGISNIDSDIKTDIVKPEINDINDLEFFTPPEINVKVGEIKVPKDIDINSVQINVDGMELDKGGRYVFGDNDKSSHQNSVVQNYNTYKNNGESLNIRFSQNDISYGNGTNSNGEIDYGGNYQTWGEDVIYLNGNLNGRTPGGWNITQGDALRKYFAITPVATFISDIKKSNTDVQEGIYNIKYEVRSESSEDIDQFVRVFLTVSPAGVSNKDFYDGYNGTATVKITNFLGELNLSTDESNYGFNGNLIGLKHQTYDIAGDRNISNYDDEAFKNSTSILLNSGTINLGEEASSLVNKNMIGMLIDVSEGTKQEQINSKTINGGEINIFGENNIGISYGQYKDTTNVNDSAVGFILRDDLYIGKINVNGTKNYGMNMGNIFSDFSTEGDKKHKGEYLTYFDKVRVYGNNNTINGDRDIHQVVDDDLVNIDENGNMTITDTDNNNDSKTITYSSKITVAGNHNAGMVIGKSLSSNAIGYEGHVDWDNNNIYENSDLNDEQIREWLDKGNVNPIANFEDISIEVNGEENIGFIRDKNYSENNKNDMIITDDNIKVAFGREKKDGSNEEKSYAKNSVLFRSEQYGITNNKVLDVSGAGDGVVTEPNESFYNIAMQATRQSWSKNGQLDQEGNIINDTNSAGTVTNQNKIEGTVNHMVGMMANGTVDDTLTWQNGEEASKAKAINNGTISLTGDNNIGMAVLDGNEGILNKGNIEITGTEGRGIYNETGTITSNKGKITVDGESTIAITNIKGTVNLNNTEIRIQNTSDNNNFGSTGIYSENGNINFNSKSKIVGGENSAAGIYTKSGSEITGTVNISGTKAGIISEDGTTNITNGNISYDGNGFALYTKDNGKITLDNNSTLNLGENSHGMNIDTSKKLEEDGTDNRLINLGGSTINVTSNNATVFDIVNTTNDKEKGIKIESSKYNSDVNSDENIKKYVGDYKITSDENNNGYNIAAIDGGIINLNDKDKNIEIIERYKFQRSDVNMTEDLNLSMDETNIDKFLDGQLIGIGMVSSSNISKNYTEENGKTIGEQQRAETKITIGNAKNNETPIKLIVDNTTETKNSTIGTYIDFGEISLVNGNIEVENENTNLTDNIGIYSKNGSKITTNESSSITVHGDNGIGIYAEATKHKDIIDEKNKFGGDITLININNAGDINLAGISGVGIYADGSIKSSNDETIEEIEKGTVTNSGTITVGAGGGTSENSSVGIYGINTEIISTETGVINIGCNHNEIQDGQHQGVGIYAVNSTVTAGGNINLGDGATGILLDGNSNFAENGNQKLTFGNLTTGGITNSTSRIGILASGEVSKPDDKTEVIENNPVSINFDIDMGNVIGGKAVVADERNVTLEENNTILVSHNNGRGMRALNNSTITNNGNIIVGEKVLLNIEENNEEKQLSSIGMTSANTGGVIDNKGTITVNSTSGIGIYLENKDENNITNRIDSIGNINLNGEKNIGVILKKSNLNLDGEKLSASGITFGENSKNSIGIYANDNSDITIDENITQDFKEKQTNNIILAGVNSTITNNKTITIKGNQGNNIGIYLGKDGEYKNNENGSIVTENGAIGIYADKGSGDLNNINIISDSKSVQTIGVVLNGENKEDKNISGTIFLKNTDTSTEKSNGKNIGIYSNNSNVIVNDTLTLHNANSNGTGLYLNNSTLSGEGTIKIAGTGAEDNKNSVGIYYNSDGQAGVTSSNNITVQIEKSNTIGVYVAKGNLTKEKGNKDNIIVIGEEKTVENVTGLVASAGSTINNKGHIKLDNTLKSTGLASLGGTITNSGNITIGGNSTSGTGIFLSGNSELKNTGTITISTKESENNIGIGIYAKGEEVNITSAGNFDLASGNVAIYSDGTNISNNISMAGKNTGTTALVVKSDKNGTLVGKEHVDKIEDRTQITLGKDSTGIYVLDSGVSISNVSIDATADITENSEKNNDTMSYGIYLSGEKENISSEAENYNISNTEVNIVKGIGIVLNDKLQTAKDNPKFEDTLTLSGSTVNVNSYSEGDDGSGTSKETGIGIYIGNENSLTLDGGNNLNISNGTGIYGHNSNITINGTNNINLQGYSVGVYGDGGTIKIEEGTNFTFNLSDFDGKAPVGNVDTIKGAGVYAINGNIVSSAKISNENNSTNMENFIGLLGKQTENKAMSITNSGNINLSGKSVMGIAGLGNENADKDNQLTLTNNGQITISGVEGDKKNYNSVGIYGENTTINNNGTINVGDYGAGIYYTGANSNSDITSNGTIKITGTNSLGVALVGKDSNIGKANDINISNITSNAVVGEDENSVGNLGVYAKDFNGNSLTVGKIQLTDKSMGLYLDDTSFTNGIKTGDIEVGKDGIGIAVIGGKNSRENTITRDDNSTISVGEHGTAIYVENSTLNMNTLAGVDVGKGGVVLNIKNGVLSLDTINLKDNTLTLKGNIGMILESGKDYDSNIKTKDNSKIENIKVLNGGTGIIIKGEQTSRPDIISDKATITLGSGNYNEDTSLGEYSVGIYYQNASDIGEAPKIKIAYEEKASHTIGAIYDKTYGTLTVNENDITMNNSISDSIGVIIRRDTDDKDDDGKSKSVTLIAENEVPLIKVDGNHNIGIAGKDSIINTVGDIEVGLAETSEGSVGIYLTGTTDDITHSYSGEGNINVGSHSYGIYAKNYDITQSGNITASGEGSIGIAGVIDNVENSGTHDHSHTIKITDGTITANNGAIGVYGKETDITVENGKIVTSGIHSTGIASIGNGDIIFKGTDINIQGDGSIGIYKDSIHGGNVTSTVSDSINVGEGDWTIGDKAVGIFANSGELDENDNIIKGVSIDIQNSSNMTLGAGGIGIYSKGGNTLTNNGDINVGDGIHLENGEDISSVGIYMGNSFKDYKAIGVNNGEISVGGNGSVGIWTAGYVDFVNEGNINVSDKGSGIGALATYYSTITNNGTITVAGEGSIGMLARANSKVVNNNEIIVNGSGVAMAANGSGAVAENNGTIKLELPNGEDTELNSSMIGMGAFNGGHIINNGEIYAGAGIGMYFDENSSLVNNKNIEISNGIGILGNGNLINKGNIHITPNGSGKDVVDGELSDIENGSIIINDIDRIVEINDNFSNIGGIIETDYDMHLNNPTVDITQGGAGFDAPNISGEIKLDSNFALEGNGISYTVEDFIDKDADIKVNTSILFNPEISEDGDLTVTKNPYKDISVGDFDERDNALDEILANGSSGMDALKNLNYYLNNIGNPDILRNEYERVAGAMSGNVYANIQSRMQDISRTFDNSFDEMVSKENLSYENEKFGLIYTNGNYENTRKGVLDYDYNIAGFNYMKEYEQLELNKKYGYEFGFAGSKFKFKDSESEEKIYSLRGGVHQVKNLENGISVLSRAEIGYNRHDMDREVSFGGDTYKNSSDFNSYQISIDNKARKSVYKDEKVDLGIYTGLNLEYGIFDDVKDDGDLGKIKVKSNDYLSSKAFIGFDAEAVKNLKNDWAVRITGDVNYSYDFGNNYDENEVKLGENYISLLSELESRDVVSGKVSVALDKSDYMTIALEGNLSKDFNRDEDYWNVGLRFTYVFGNDKFPTEFLNMKNYFDFDKSELKQEGKTSIKNMSEYLDKKHIKGTVLIEGHSDSVGAKNYNQKLSEKRAETVKKEFQKNIKSNDIDFITKGYGERKPVATNDTKDGRTQNRRTEINLINRQ